MSRRNGPKLELKLNISPPRMNRRVGSPSGSPASVSSSPQSSCVSSEHHQDDDSNSPEPTSMLLVGCPNCLMYVMLSEQDPRCPKCKTGVLLHVLQDNNATNKKNAKKC